MKKYQRVNKISGEKDLQIGAKTGWNTEKNGHGWPGSGFC